MLRRFATRCAIVLAMTALGLAAPPPNAFAQTYPERPVRPAIPQV
jgi:hypothetical protein